MAPGQRVGSGQTVAGVGRAAFAWRQPSGGLHMPSHAGTALPPTPPPPHLQQLGRSRLLQLLGGHRHRALLQLWRCWRPRAAPRLYRLLLRLLRGWRRGGGAVGGGPARQRRQRHQACGGRRGGHCQGVDPGYRRQFSGCKRGVGPAGDLPKPTASRALRLGSWGCAAHRTLVLQRLASAGRSRGTQRCGTSAEQLIAGSAPLPRPASEPGDGRHSRENDRGRALPSHTPHQAAHAATLPPPAIRVGRSRSPPRPAAIGPYTRDEGKKCWA